MIGNVYASRERIIEYIRGERERPSQSSIQYRKRERNEWERVRKKTRASNQEIRLIAYWRVTTTAQSMLASFSFLLPMTYLNEVRSRMLLVPMLPERELEMQDWPAIYETKKSLAPMHELPL